MNQRARLSLLVVQIFIFSLLFGLMGRLFYLQVAAGPKYRDAALSIQSRDVVTPATRGLIVDSSGVPLALNRVGVAITVESTLNVFVSNNSWSWVPSFCSVGTEINTSAYVIGVAVGVNQCVESRIGPSANGINNLLARVFVAGVKTDQPIA